MRVLNAIQRALLLLLLIPVIAICLDAMLRAFGARPRNPIVSGVNDIAAVFILDPFRTVFPNQTYVQDAAVALVAYGIIALLIVFLFRGLRAMVGSRPPRVQPAPSRPAPAGPPAKKAETAASTGTKPDPPPSATASGDGGSQSTSSGA